MERVIVTKAVDINTNESENLLFFIMRGGQYFIFSKL